MKTLTGLILLLLCGLVSPPASADELPPLKILFVGDDRAHAPRARFAQLQPVFAQRNITLAYEDDLAVLTTENLSKFDGLMIFANHDRGKPEAIQAIVDFVKSGKGFIPVHCGSFCFTNNEDYIKLVGAQFRSHTTGVFRVKATEAKHPILEGYDCFESWDETYIHHKHNDTNRTILETRTDGDLVEPWTWVRTEGQGRVFYTAWGHDQRTWSHPGFHNLLERGTRWACGQDPALAGPYRDAPKMIPPTGTKEDFTYLPAEVPFYPPSRTWGTLAEPLKEMQAPLPPEVSMKHYSLPEGFQLELFAADQDFQGGKPMAMTWDDRGRLWAIVTVDYPNELQRPGQGRDKIVILEDTTGDGRADKFTVFADKLSIPTSLIHVKGGVVVHQAPQTLFLRDTTGDDVADERIVLFDGWATYDTHAGPSNLRYGFDGWIYGSVGYAGFNGTVNGERHSFKQGYYRFWLENDAQGKVQATKLEFLRSTNNNTWGFAFDEQGKMFGSTANGCPLVHLDIPNRYYERVRGLNASVLPNIVYSNTYHPITDKIRQVDYHNGFTSAAHCAIYTARTYPAEYWNKAAFVSDPTGHLTATLQLHPTPAGYTARYGWNLLASQDEWAAPIDAQVGPDGQVWVLDWYNYIVQHNPTPKGFKTGKGAAYETDLRDKKHGRVYRVVYKAGTPSAKPKLDTPQDLVSALKSDNLFWRLHAMRLLRERGAIAAVATELKALAEHEFASVPVRYLLHDEFPAKPGSAKTVSDWLELADAPTTSEVGPALLAALHSLNRFTEKPLTDAITIAAASHPTVVLAAIATDAAAWSPEGLAALEKVALNFASNSPSEFATLLRGMPATAAGDIVLRGLVNGWPKGETPTFTPTELADFKTLVAQSNAERKRTLLKLGVQWKLPGLEEEAAALSQSLISTAMNETKPETERIAAAREAIEFRPTDEAAMLKLLESLNANSSPRYTQAILDLANQSQSKTLGTTLLDKLQTLPSQVKPLALRVILARPDATIALLDAVEAGKVRFDSLALDQRSSLATHPNKTIAERAKKLLALGGGLPDPNRQKVIDDLLPILTKVGDVANGKKMFIAHCAKCHKHGSEGLNIGPDLTGFAVHPKEEILIHVMDPSRSVEGNYRTYTATTIDGKVISGLLASETRTTVELLDAENKRHIIERDDLELFTESKLSLMPEGFEKSMTRDEITDLLEFLTQKGKYVPIPLDKYATISSTQGMFNDAESSAERMVYRDWSPKTYDEVPFVLTDPQGGKVKNAMLLYSQQGKFPPLMPKSILMPCNTPAKAIHFLGGVAGWASPYGEKGSVSVIVRLHYADGKKEDHPLKNGEHIADYIRRVDVPSSKFAASLRGAQIRTVSVTPQRTEPIQAIELVKGPDSTAPVFLAVTIETP